MPNADKPEQGNLCWCKLEESKLIKPLYIQSYTDLITKIRHCPFDEKNFNEVQEP